MATLVDHNVVPSYPAEALAKGVQGDVIFKIVIDQNGSIVRSDSETGHALLVATSATALKDYRFHPYLVDGSPAKAEGHWDFTSL